MDGIYLSIPSEEYVELLEIKERYEKERKCGRWVEETHETWAGGKATVCSACGYGYAVDAFFEVEAFNYCPNCGAKMEEDE